MTLPEQLERYRGLLFAALLALVTTLVYLPGLNGGFVFDDVSNILLPDGVAMKTLNWQELKEAALSMDRRAISRATFGLNHLIAGFDPFTFKLVNLLIHIANGLLLYALTRRLLQVLTERLAIAMGTSLTEWIAMATAAAWTLHPVNLTSVLYIVQRMNSLSTLFVFCGLLLYIEGRQRLDSQPGAGWPAMVAAVAVFTPLAFFSKENGALLPAFVFLVEWLIFGFRTESRTQRNGLILFFGGFLVLPVLGAIIYIVQHPWQFHSGFGNRYFSLEERLLTQPRVLWLYVRMILLPAQSVYGLFLDDIALSKSLFEPITTLPALLGIVLLPIIAVLVHKRLPVLAFGMLLFLVGHVMEGTFIPLEIAFEHRNYLPSSGLLLALMYYVFALPRGATWQAVSFSLAIAMVAYLGYHTYQRAWSWSNNNRLYLTEARHHPDSPRANYEAGKVYAQRLERGEGDNEANYRQAVIFFTRVTGLRRNTTSGLFGNILASIDAGKPIDPTWIDELDRRLQNEPMEKVNIFWLSRLTDCIVDRKCNQEQIPLSRLIESAKHNQKANSRTRALVYSIAAGYHTKIEGDMERATKEMQMAVKQMPSDPLYRIGLSDLFYQTGRYSQAMNSLIEAIKRDGNGQYTSVIEARKRRLDATQK